MPTLPSGTVTFLFTDIEGSTRLWEEHPGAMRLALARHDDLLRMAIEKNNGVVFKKMGDAFCAVFATASDAINAALASQLLLLNEVWEQTGPLRVRMALHTGEAEERDGDYFGPTLNRVARLQSAGQGGQTLLSEAVQTLVGSVLPVGVALKDMGVHRLKDLQVPEHVFQLCHPRLPDVFPPLHSLNNLPNNLPRQPNSFIGREEEMQTVQQLLRTSPLVTLTGTGGCGKTRLALQVAAEVLEDYTDGVWLVELASLSEPSLIPQTVASALGVREEPSRPLTQTLTDYLKPKKLLILLDNCEHLPSACAVLTETLVKNCPNLSVLATSREPLNIPAEHPWRVPSLLSPDSRKLPDEEKDIATVLLDYTAVRLFVERAMMHRPGFALTRQNASAVASVCHRLDGIPLALELAAARVKVLPVEQIVARLDDRFRMLTGGSRTALPRQQTLRALLDWSYDLLNDQEQHLLQRLAVFAGGWLLEAAEAVCAGEGIDAREVLELLLLLVDKSVVVYEERAEGARYRLQETVRQYANDRLLEAGQAPAYRIQHQDYYLALAEEAETHLTGPEQAVWFETLETEHDNLRRALEGCKMEQAGLRLAVALHYFWVTHGHLREGRFWLEAMLVQSGERNVLCANALRAASVLTRSLGDYTTAHRYGVDSLTLYRELGDTSGIAKAIGTLALVAERKNELTLAQGMYEESLALHRSLKDTPSVAIVLTNLGNLESWLGDFATARLCLEEALTIDRELGDKRGISFDLANLASLAYRQGDYRSAQALYQESLNIKQDLGDRGGMAWQIGNLGLILEKQEQYTRAGTLYEEALALHRVTEQQKGVAWTLDRLAGVAHQQGDLARAHAWLAESLSLYRKMGDQMSIASAIASQAESLSEQGDFLQATRLMACAEGIRLSLPSSWSVNDQETIEKLLARLRAALSEEAFAVVWEEGNALTLEQAIISVCQ
jgi:predicted ATPase/class 3 adenylate cyclase/Tfp pilus assembly protein PilF